jgi:dCMP deaminase
LSKIIIAYIPVLHRGYLNFLDKHSDAEKLYVIGQEFLDQLPQLRKDIRALKPSQMVAALQSQLPNLEISLLTPSVVTAVLQNVTIIMPDEDISHLVAEKYCAGSNIQYDSVFLRWDSQKSLAPQTVKPDEEISSDELAQRFLQRAQDQAQKSSDWWRQVGAVVVKDGKIVLEGFNQHVPTQAEPYYNGDPRGNFHKGEHIDLSTALHAEAGVIAQAARKGISLEGTKLYVTTFPCPNCARLIAYSGIKEVYFKEGYAMVDGESIMKERRVKIVKVRL